MRSETSDRPLYGLEILRFGAAFAVVVWHYQFFFFAVRGDPEQLPFHGALTVFYAAGHYAVPWFWVLSGYIFFWKYEASIAKRAISATEFGLLRFSRLYPLHLLTLLLVTFLQIAYASWYGAFWQYDAPSNSFVTHLLLASNWFTTAKTFNGPIWSISIEVVVYAIFFTLAQSAAVRTAQGTAVAVIVFLLGFWVTARMLPGSLIWLLTCLKCAGCFFLGGMLVKCREAIRSTRVLVLALALGSVPLILLRPSCAWVFTLPALGVLVFTTGAVWQHPLIRGAARLGNLTYASYLLHFPVALAIVLALRCASVSLEVALSRWFFLAYFVAVFGLSHLSFKYLERPMQTLIRRRMQLFGSELQAQ